MGAQHVKTAIGNDIGSEGQELTARHCQCERRRDPSSEEAYGGVV